METLKSVLFNDVQPIGLRVLVERLSQPERLIKLTDAEKYRKFKVVAIGKDVSEVKPGDVVVLPGVAANEPDFEIGERMLVLEGDIGWKIG